MTWHVMVTRQLASYSPLMAAAPVGDLLRDWRVRRHLSQLDVAVGAGVSTRHLSYVETGKSRPSPEMVLSLAAFLDVPLRERNTLLLAAGHAPRFGEAPLDHPSMSIVRSSITRMLDAHDPYPAIVANRDWNLELANNAALRLVGHLPAELLEPPINVYRLALAPNGLAASSPNLHEWAPTWIGALRRQIIMSPTADLESLHDELCAYPHIADVLERHEFADAPDVMIQIDLDTPAGRLALFTTLTTFGTPTDITLSELVIELFWPADEASSALLRQASS